MLILCGIDNVNKVDDFNHDICIWILLPHDECFSAKKLIINVTNDLLTFKCSL